MLELQKDIFEFTKKLTYEIKSDYFLIQNVSEVQDLLSQRTIESQIERHNGENHISIKFSTIGFGIFKNIHDYLNVTNVRNYKSVLILDFDDSVISLIEGEKVFKNFNEIKEFYFFKNSIKFLDYIDFLKSKQIDEDSFHFIDYCNEVERKIVLTSLTEKSRLIINYHKQVPRFESDKDYARGFDEFKSCFSERNKNLPRFLKSTFIQFASRHNENDRIELTFKGIGQIVEEAKVNFEIFISNLSIDSIRKDYEDYKSKYLGDVSEILKKLTQQIIGFPILMASTLFAIEKIRSNSALLVVLAIIIFATTLYLVLIYFLNIKDLGHVKRLSDRDYKSVVKNEFFTKYPDELKEFKNVKSRIFDRVKHLEILSEFYFWTLVLSNTFIVFLIIGYLGLVFNYAFIISVIMLFIIVIIRSYFADNSDLEH
jgi:hypothetical protein